MVEAEGIERPGFMMCAHCHYGPSEGNPLVEVGRSLAQNKAICRRCLIRAALAMDPMGERIIVRVPELEDAATASALPTEGLIVRSVMDGIAAWTIRARALMADRFHRLIADRRRQTTACEAEIEGAIRDAADLGIDLNAPKPTESAKDGDCCALHGDDVGPPLGP